MAKIKVEKTTSLAAKDAFEKIKEYFSNDRDLRKLDSNYQCQFDENALSGTIKSSKFQAVMLVKSEGGTCKVQVEITLPFMLTPFKGFVEKTVQEKLGKLFG